MTVRTTALSHTARLFGIVLLGGGLAACTVSSDLESGTASYQCEGDPDVVAEFSDNGESVQVTVDDETYDMDLTDRSGDALVYEGDNDSRLVLEGHQAEFSSDDVDSENCEIRT